MKNSKITLGISDSHDSGACFFIGDKLVYAVSEERLNRKKNYSGFPFLSISEGLKFLKIKPEDINNIACAGISRFIDEITTNNNLKNQDGTINKKFIIISFLSKFIFFQKIFKSKIFFFFNTVTQFLFSKKRCNEIRANLKKININIKNINLYDHHDCHVFSAYCSSTFNNALIFSNDGMGDGVCSKVFFIKKNKAFCLKVNSFYNSLGMLYGYATDICGFKKNHHAGKTTSLSAHGSPNETFKIFSKYFEWNEKKGIYLNNGPVFLECLTNLKKDLIKFKKEDIAAGIQKITDIAIINQVKFFTKAFKTRNICFTGGLHANVLTNLRVSENFPRKKIFVYPAMADTGLPVGAACLDIKRRTKKIIKIRLNNYYLGSKFSDSEIKKFLIEKYIKFDTPKNLNSIIAKYLYNNKIVGRFSGKFEFGPRALGNRSILYNAKSFKINRLLNKRLKRTETMPFAPVILDKFSKNYIKNYNKNNIDSYKNMTMCCHASNLCKKNSPGAVHIDGTLRPQVLTKKYNPEYYDLLLKYYKLTKIPLLINTSFNLHEEPIVTSPEQAYRSFVESKIDAHVLNKYLILKKNNA